MGGSNPDEIILSYNDVVLRRLDLDILSGPYFLNDRIIEFYFSYLDTCYPSQDVLLVTPSISFWIMNCFESETLKEFVKPLNLPAKKLILFPVNDNEDVCLAEGGSHWSLVVYFRDTNTFVHHDSNRGMNIRAAKRLHKMVSKFVCDHPDSAFDPKFVHCPETPQQKNSHDCGLYVTAIVRVICLWYHNGGNEGDLQILLKDKVTLSAVSEMRNEILALIRGIMVKK